MKLLFFACLPLSGGFLTESQLESHGLLQMTRANDALSIRINAGAETEESWKTVEGMDPDLYAIKHAAEAAAEAFADGFDILKIEKVEDLNPVVKGHEFFMASGHAIMELVAPSTPFPDVASMSLPEMSTAVTKCFDADTQRVKDQGLEVGAMEAGAALLEATEIPVLAGIAKFASVTTGVFHTYESANAVECAQLGHTVTNQMLMRQDKKIDALGSQLGKLRKGQAKLRRQLTLEAEQTRALFKSNLDGVKDIMLRGQAKIQEQIGALEQTAKMRHSQTQAQWGRAERQMHSQTQSQNEMRRDLTKLSHRFDDLQQRLLAEEFIGTSIKLMENLQSLGAAEEDYLAALTNKQLAEEGAVQLIGVVAETQEEVETIKADFRKEIIKVWQRARDAVSSIAVILEESDFLTKHFQFGLTSVLRRVVSNQRCEGVLTDKTLFRAAVKTFLNEDEFLPSLSAALNIGYDLFTSSVLIVGYAAIPNDNFWESMQTIKVALALLHNQFGHAVLEDSLLDAQAEWLPLLCPLTPSCLNAVTRHHSLSGVSPDNGVQVTDTIIAFDPLRKKTFYECSGMKMSGLATSTSNFYKEGKLGMAGCPSLSFERAWDPESYCDSRVCDLTTDSSGFTSKVTVHIKVAAQKTCREAKAGKGDSGCNGYDRFTLSEDKSRDLLKSLNYPSPCCNTPKRITLQCPDGMVNYKQLPSDTLMVTLKCDSSPPEHLFNQDLFSPAQWHSKKFTHVLQWKWDSGQPGEENYDVSKHPVCSRQGTQAENNELIVKNDYKLDDKPDDTAPLDKFNEIVSLMINRVNLWAPIINKPACAFSCRKQGWLKKYDRGPCIDCLDGTAEKEALERKTKAERILTEARNKVEMAEKNRAFMAEQRRLAVLREEQCFKVSGKACPETSLASKVGDAVDAIGDTWDAVGQATAGHVDAIGDAFGDVGDAFGDALDSHASAAVVGHVDAIGDAVGDAWDAVTSGSAAAEAGAGAAADAAVDRLEQAGANVADAAGDHFSKLGDVWDSLW